MLFEFQLLLIRIAFDSFPKELEKKDVGVVLERLLKYLYLRSNAHFEDGKADLPALNRKMILRMKEYYSVLHGSSQSALQPDRLPQESLSPFEILAKKMQKEIDQAPDLRLDFGDIFKNL